MGFGHNVVSREKRLEETLSSRSFLRVNQVPNQYPGIENGKGSEGRNCPRLPGLSCLFPFPLSKLLGYLQQGVEKRRAK